VTTTKKKANGVEPPPAPRATRGAAVATGTPLPRSTPPPMSQAEYDAALADLNAEKAALDVAYTTSQTYPRTAYHATEPPQLVHSDAEAVALGAGWSAEPVPPPPPVVTALVPDTAVLGSPSFTLHITGSGFDAASVIVFAGQDEPTTLVSPTEVTTGVNMAVWAGPDALPVLVRNGDGQTSEALTFTFTAAVTARRKATAD
jgi:hypothetical protein